MGLVNGEDFVFSGFDEGLGWIARELAKQFLLCMGKLGDNVQGGDAQAAKCLNRGIRRASSWCAMEADPRHTELPAAMLGSRVAPHRHSGGSRIGAGSRSHPRGRTRGQSGVSR